MEKEYMKFVEAFRQKLRLELGLADEAVYFVKHGEKYAEDGDKLMVRSGICGTYLEERGIYIEALYEQYLKGYSVEEMVKILSAEFAVKKTAGYLNKLKELEDYDRVKESLFIRLLSFETDSSKLKDAVYRVIGDIALVLCYKVMESGEGLISCSVPGNYLKKWGRDAKTVFDAALENTARMSPPRIYEWIKMLAIDGYEGEELNSETKLNKELCGNCLSTKKKLNGAVSIFYPGVAEQIGKIFGEDYYIVATSQHEVMLHAVSTAELDCLSEALKSTIKETVSRDEHLTSSIYCYYRDNDCILPVEKSSLEMAV